MSNRKEYLKKYEAEHKYERHFINRRYYYAHKYKWHKDSYSLGSLSTKYIYNLDSVKFQKYIHNIAEKIRNYKQLESRTVSNNRGIAYAEDKYYPDTYIVDKDDEDKDEDNEIDK